MTSARAMSSLMPVSRRAAVTATSTVAPGTSMECRASSISR
ncbi:hypothetical protein [Corynebacterium variabile]